MRAVNEQPIRAFPSQCSRVFRSTVPTTAAAPGNASTGATRAQAPASTAAESPTEVNALLTAAAQDLADYQRLTAEGKLGDAGRKLEDLKRKLDQLASQRR